MEMSPDGPGVGVDQVLTYHGELLPHLRLNGVGGPDQLWIVVIIVVTRFGRRRRNINERYRIGNSTQIVLVRTKDQLVR